MFKENVKTRLLSIFIILFCFAFSIKYSFKGLITNDFLFVFIAEFLVSLYGIILVILLKKYYQRDVIFLSAISLVSLITGLHLLLIFSIVYILFREENLDFCVKFFIVAMTLHFAFNLIIANNIFDYITTDSRENRFLLGFVHPNIASAHVFAIMMSGFILIRKKSNLFKVGYYFTAFMIIYFTFLLTGTRSIVVTYILFGFLLLFLAIIKYLPNYFMSILVITPILMIIASLLVTFFYNDKINSILSTRPHLWFLLIKNQVNFIIGDISISSFWKQLEYAVDNDYIYILYSAGILGLTLVYTCYVLSLYFLYRHQEYMLIMIINAFLFYSFFEARMFSPSNFSLFIIITICGKLFPEKKNGLIL